MGASSVAYCILAMLRNYLTPRVGQVRLPYCTGHETYRLFRFASAALMFLFRVNLTFRIFCIGVPIVNSDIGWCAMQPASDMSFVD